MSETEGVIKYQLTHLSTAFDNSISISNINSWRTIIYSLGLIGKIEQRYEGYGFGNISQRILLTDTDNTQFIISGTQTGGIKSLSLHNYCHVTCANPKLNSLSSIGKTEPSSEALTHASVYQQDSSIFAVLHVHCPEIWRNTKTLKIPHTTASIPYGTPEMAAAVSNLMQTKQLKSKKIFTMLGHKDGVISFAASIEKAALITIQYLEKAIRVEQLNR